MVLDKSLKSTHGCSGFSDDEPCDVPNIGSDIWSHAYYSFEGQKRSQSFKATMTIIHQLLNQHRHKKPLIDRAVEWISEGEATVQSASAELESLLRELSLTL